MKKKFDDYEWMNPDLAGHTFAARQERAKTKATVPKLARAAEPGSRC